MEDDARVRLLTVTMNGTVLMSSRKKPGVMTCCRIFPCQPNTSFSRYEQLAVSLNVIPDVIAGDCHLSNFDLLGLSKLSN